MHIHMSMLGISNGAEDGALLKGVLHCGFCLG